MKALFLSAAILFAFGCKAQLRMPADGGSMKAMVGEQIGITDVTISYGRPGVKGREGKIWGEVVHAGFTEDNNFGKKRMIPWRAGANENTTIEFSTDVLVEGKRLPAGKYGLFMAYDPHETIVIFNRNTDAWGSYFYNEKDDALRVKVKPVAADQGMERLTYVFSDQTDSSAVVSLQWEKLKIPFRVSTELKQLQLASIEKEMNGTKAFYGHNHLEAGRYYKEHNMPVKALEHITSASRIMPSFFVLSQKAELLEVMGNTKESEEAMKLAINAVDNPYQLHGYARRLLAEKKTGKAMELFKLNYSKFPDTYTTNVGMARAYEASGDIKQALKYANKALPQAPDESNKASTEALIKNLKESKVAKS